MVTPRISMNVSAKSICKLLSREHKNEVITKAVTNALSGLNISANMERPDRRISTLVDKVT